MNLWGKGTNIQSITDTTELRLWQVDKTHESVGLGEDTRRRNSGRKGWEIVRGSL